MKKIFLSVFAVIALSLLSQAQFSVDSGTQKADRVVFLNGSVKEGKVVSFADEKIRFVHRGETLNYELSKKEIEKIEYASGRTEVITERKAREVSIVPVNSRNRVAVMPMIYIGDGDDERTEEMRFQLQDIAVSYLSKSAAELRFMDVAELNAVLYRNGINDENIRQYAPKELAALLHVEYIIMGSVVQDKGRLVTVSNSHNTRRQTSEQWHRHGHEYKTTRNNRNSTSVTKQQIQTQVSLSIYNETGERIYSKSRQSILSEPDAYRNAIQYLLKRTPLYNR